MAKQVTITQARDRLSALVRSAELVGGFAARRRSPHDGPPSWADEGRLGPVFGRHQTSAGNGTASFCEQPWESSAARLPAHRERPQRGTS